MLKSKLYPKSYTLNSKAEIIKMKNSTTRAATLDMFRELRELHYMLCFEVLFRVECGVQVLQGPCGMGSWRVPLGSLGKLRE